MEENTQSTSGTSPISPQNEDSTQPTRIADVPPNDNTGKRNSNIMKGAFIALLVLAIPVGMILVKNTTDSRSHAAEFSGLSPTLPIPTVTPPPVRTTPGLKTTITQITPTSPPYPTLSLTPVPTRYTTPKLTLVPTTFLTPTPTPRTIFGTPTPSP